MPKLFILSLPGVRHTHMPYVLAPSCQPFDGLALFVFPPKTLGKDERPAMTPSECIDKYLDLLVKAEAYGVKKYAEILQRSTSRVYTVIRLSLIHI